MKTVVLVAPHFFPSFLAAVHRARLWAEYLPDFGWTPVIVTTDPSYYECQTDPSLNEMLPAGLEIVRTRAFPTRPVRLVGNLGFRAAWWYYAAIRDLSRRRKIDFVHITCDAFAAALIGPSVERRLGIPYGIDYQDPWLPETPRHNPILSKAWLSERLSRRLEPYAVSRARLITGINQQYFASMLRRNPGVAQRAVTASMPFGSSSRDFDFLRMRPRKPFVFDPSDGNIHLIYAGAFLPHSHSVLDRLFEAITLLRRDTSYASRLRLHFVGTGTHEGDPTRGHLVRPYIEKWRLEDIAEELPNRIPFLDVLNHLAASDAVLVIGSTEPHYSPSKIYQAALSGRPVFALLHEECTAAALLRESGAGRVFGFTAESLPEPRTLARALDEFLARDQPVRTVDTSVFERDSARESARVLAAALDEAVQRNQEARGA